MQDQLDMLILERVSEGHFDITVPKSSYSDDIAREYRARGFVVRTNDTHTTIKWDGPELNSDTPNKKIYSLFTAQQLYYVLTEGKDHRLLTHSVMYNRLIREEKTIETYGMNPAAVYNLFSESIELARMKGFSVVVGTDGVITSKLNQDFDVDDCREVNGPIYDVDDQKSLSVVISGDTNNKLVLGTDGKLYVENSLTQTEW